MSPPVLAATVLGASTVTTVGAVIVVLMMLGFVIYVVANVRAGRQEVGSEIELAPNRKPYLSDDELETSKLDRTLRWGLMLLGISAVGLPLYWLNEPAREDGAVEGFESTFVRRGQALFEDEFQCDSCHGPAGSGGDAPYTVLDGNGDFVAQVTWKAPALDTVLLRYSREEVEYIINYGRPFSPMPGWGAAVGKGALNEQQIGNIIDYLASIQKAPEESQRDVQIELATELGLLDQADASDPEAVDAAIAEIDYTDPETGEALFNLGKDSGFASGAYACARCHTRGWSINEGSQEPPDADLSDYTDFPDGSGAMGPNLTGGLVPRAFATVEQLEEFITLGSVDGELYGRNGSGTGRMPGFGDNPNTPDTEGDGMLTPEMIEAIARYEDGLPGADRTTNAPPVPTAESSDGESSP